MDLAKGYRLGDMERGNRILSRIGHGPVAAARDPELSLITLVSLSHLLGLPVPAIKRTYLFEHGAPLLVDGRRRDADRLTPRDPYAPGSRLTIVGRHQTARPLSSGYQDIVTATYNTRTATEPPLDLRASAAFSQGAVAVDRVTASRQHHHPTLVPGGVEPLTRCRGDGFCALR